MPLGFSQFADRQVDRNAKEPGVRPRFPAKTVDFYQGSSECLLRQFTSLLAIGDDSQDGIVEPILEEDHDLSERGAIAGLSFAEQIGFATDAGRRLRQFGLELGVAQARHEFRRWKVREVPREKSADERHVSADSGHPWPAKEPICPPVAGTSTESRRLRRF